MRIIYNGVDLQVLETHQYDMECVMDDSMTDYLYTKHTVVVRAIVNGQVDVYAGLIADDGKFYRNGPAITYAVNSNVSDLKSSQAAGGVGGPVPGVTPPGVGQPAPAATVGPFSVGGQRVDPVQPAPPGVFNGIMDPATGLAAGTTNQIFQIVPVPNSPTASIQTIRHRLTTPRGRLFVFSGGWDGNVPAPVLLMSPNDGCRCDCNNGPIPRIMSIPQVFGDATTMMLDFAVETYVNESAENGVYLPGVLLSNRFKQTHVIGADSFTSINTSGFALFRTDLVYKLPTSPDAARPQLMLPIPRGFVRENVVVEAIPSVAGVAYQFVDRQVPVNFPAGPYVKAAHISAVHRQAMTQNEGIFKSALQAYERFLGIGAQKNIARASIGPEATHASVINNITNNVTNNRRSARTVNVRHTTTVKSTTQNTLNLASSRHLTLNR